MEHAKTVYIKHSAIYKYKKNEGGLCSNVSDEYLKDLNLLYEKMDKFIIAKNLNNDACEIMHNSMLGSVFRAVGLAVGNGCSKKKIGQRLKNLIAYKNCLNIAIKIIHMRFERSY